MQASGMPEERQATSQAKVREQHTNDTNVGEAERVASALGGALLTVYGLRTAPRGLLLAALGGALLYRGLSGHCAVYQALGVSTASQAPASAVRVEETTTVATSPAEAYRFWRNFENLPRFMPHLESVRVYDDKRSHWVVKAPLGTTVAWDAEIFLEKANELIAWRSLPGADIASAGTVRFSPTAEGETEVRVIVEYQPPAGALGMGLARLLGAEPDQQVRDDLRRFKEMIEAGG
jgi:uncharacterized membrane protein